MKKILNLRKPLTIERLRLNLRKIFRSLRVKHLNISIMTKVVLDNNSYKSLSKREDINLQNSKNITQYIDTTTNSYRNKIKYSKYEPKNIKKLVFDLKRIKSEY